MVRILGIDPGVDVLAAAVLADGAVVFAASISLRGAAVAAWAEVIDACIAVAEADLVVVEAQNMRFGPCAFIEGLVHGAAAARGVPCARHVPRAMHKACPGFGGYRANKTHGAAIVRRLLPDWPALDVAQYDARRTDTFDAALFVLWHTRPADVREAAAILHDERQAAGPARRGGRPVVRQRARAPRAGRALRVPGARHPREGRRARDADPEGEREGSA